MRWLHGSRRYATSKSDLEQAGGSRTILKERHENEARTRLTPDVQLSISAIGRVKPADDATARILRYISCWPPQWQASPIYEGQSLGDKFVHGRCLQKMEREGASRISKGVASCCPYSAITHTLVERTPRIAC